MLALTACSGARVSYYPLDPGLWWHYRITRTTMDGTAVQTHIVRNLHARTVQGAEMVPRETPDGVEVLYQANERGVFRTGVRAIDSDTDHVDAVPRLVLPANPVPGTTWRATTRTAVLEKTGPPQETLYRILVEMPMQYVVENADDVVDVPAGRYERCLRVRGRASTNASVGNYIGTTTVTIESLDWFAPGVGLVRSERVESTSNQALDAGRYAMELVAFRRG